MGRLSALATVVWMTGPMVGGWLNAKHHALPGLVAAAIYAADIAFVLAFLRAGAPAQVGQRA